MTGYTKLFGSIVLSTIWREPNHIRIVWITMLALANKHGIVEGSVPGLADLCRVSVEECREALNKLQSPDPDSRSKERGGRRIEPIDGGWLLVNHAKYRAKLNQDERREYLRIKKQESRSKNVNKCPELSTPSTQPEAAPEAEGEKKPPQSFEGASPTARLILHEKELGRVTERMKSIKASYSEHQAMSAGDKETFMKLRERKLELQKLLGVTA